MLKLLPYVLKTLWRHRSRTLLTVSGSSVALFVFCFVASIQEGMNDLQKQSEAKRSLIVFQVNKFCPATSHLPQDYSLEIEKLDDVRDVMPIQVITNNCRASLDVVVFYGVPAPKVRAMRDYTMISGDLAEFESHQDSAIAGRSVAARRGLKTGDTFTMGDMSVKIAGIFASDNPSDENYIYAHLDFLQRGKGQNLVGTVTQFEIALDEDADAEQVAKEVDLLFRSGTVGTDTRPKGAFQAKSLGDLTQLISMAHYLGFACVGLVLTLVATTTVMSVQDRISEHAVLQTLGFTSRKVFLLVLFESVLLSVCGGVLGVSVAIGVLKLTNLSVGADAVTIAFSSTPGLAVRGIVISLIAGLLAGVAPGLHAARTDIVTALKHG